MATFPAVGRRDVGEAFIVDAARTPIGKRDGALASLHPAVLFGDLVRARLEAVGVDPHDVDDVVCGCATKCGEQGGNIARLAILAAGLPVSLSATTVDRQCGSSLTAINMAAASVMSGAQDLVVAGGVESMSRVPMASDGLKLPEPYVERFDVVGQGYSAELIAQRWNLSRHELALWSCESHRRAIAARTAFGREIVPVTVSDNGSSRIVASDEGPRPDTTVEKIEGLKTPFKADGVISAGNSSQISDGAACVTIASPDCAKRLGLWPRARILSFAYAGVDPTIMLTGPIYAIPKALAKAGLALNQIDFIELNEAFMSVVLATRDELGLDMERTNARGGAVALGHPLGASGARLVVTLLHILEDHGAHYGLASLCIGFGDGVATVIERL